VTRRSVLAGSLLLVAACGPIGGGGTLTARWVAAEDTTKDLVVLTMPATATWCPGPARIDIRAAAGDSGIGIALYPSDSDAVAGTYPVLEPGAPVQLRPAAGVALRWLGKAQIQGWWGDSGSLELTGGRKRSLSGRGRAWLVSGIGPDSVLPVDLAFRRLTVRTDTLCDVRVLPAGIPVDSAAAAGTPPAPGVH
jgi:hypothetical protein